MIITLSYGEIMQAATVGVMRRVSAIKAGRVDRFGPPSDQGGSGFDLWGLDIEAACAELAVAKATNSYWIGHVGGSDAHLPGDAGNYQVRSTHHKTGRLLIHDSDKDDAKFVLVLRDTPRYTLAGWLFAREAKKPELWAEYGGRHAYFAPQNMLRSMQLLLDGR